MKKLLFLLPLLYLNLMQAQKNVTKESLLKNNDISWVGEYEIMLPFDLMFKNMIESPELKIQSLKDISTYRDFRFSDIYSDSFIKTMNIENLRLAKLKEMDLNTSFAYVLANSGKNKKVTAFKDADLSQKINWDDVQKYFYSVDTLMIPDPETFVEEAKAVINYLTPEALPYCKAKLLVYFDSKLLRYNVICTAIAPMINKTDLEGNYVKTVPFFWIPVYNCEGTLDYSGSNINYTVNTLLSLDLNKADALKAVDKPLDAIKKIFEGHRKKGSNSEVYAGQIGLDTQSYKFTNKDLENFGCRIDSIFTADPETGNIFSQVVETCLNADNFTEIVRFEINWYWDRKDQKLKATTLSFAPVIDIIDNNGLVITTTPAFYKKVCKGKVHRPQWEYR
jgi:hypothetical protein